MEPGIQQWKDLALLSEGQVEFGGRRYPATFETDRVSITIGYPPSEGFWPTFILEYRR